MSEVEIERITSLLAIAANEVNRLSKLETEITRLRSALERITRECGAPNKGTVAAAIARQTLFPPPPASDD